MSPLRRRNFSVGNFKLRNRSLFHICEKKNDMSLTSDLVLIIAVSAHTDVSLLHSDTFCAFTTDNR